MRIGRVVIAALGAAMFACGGCRKAKKNDSSIPGISSGAPVHVEGASLVRRSLAETREALAATYRLAPDRRLLDAVAFLDFRLTGTSATPVTARFEGGAWQLE